MSAGLCALELRINRSLNIVDRTHVFNLLIVQNHFSEVAVDTDMDRRKMSTVETFSDLKSSTVLLRVFSKLSKKAWQPFQHKFNVT